MRGRADEKTRNYSDTRPSADEDTTRRTREIREEIEQTRGEMSETIDAIQEKLRPGNIVSGATDRVKDATSRTVRNTTERVRNMMGSGSERGQGAMEQTRHYADEMMEGAKHNVIPIAMIGAGLAWLLVDRFRGDDRDREYGYRRYRRPYGTEYEEYDESEAYAGGPLSESGPGYTTDWDRQQRARALTGSGYRSSSRIGERASEARDRAMRATRRGRSRLQHMLNDNPLLVAGGALMLGAALGMALPETETENEWMGETKEDMMERAQDAARNAASRAQDAVGDVAGEVASRVVSGKEDNK